MDKDFSVAVHLGYKKIVNLTRSSLKEFNKISESRYNDLMLRFEKETILTPEVKEKLKQELIDDRKESGQRRKDTAQVQTGIWLAELKRKLGDSLKTKHQKDLKGLEEKRKKIIAYIAQNKKKKSTEKKKPAQKLIPEKTSQSKTGKFLEIKKWSLAKPTHTTTKPKSKPKSMPKKKDRVSLSWDKKKDKLMFEKRSPKKK